MRIAQIAPPWLPIPPKNYGGTEAIIYNLIEELVAQGHDVTLFAPGDAKTSARLVSFFSTSLIESGTPWNMHPKAYYHLHKALEQVKAQRFDIVHTHLSTSSDLYIFPLTASLSVPHVTTLHSNFPFDRGPNNWIGDADKYFLEWAPQMPTVAISESARKQAPRQLNFIGVVYNGIPMSMFKSTRKAQEDYFFWLGRFSPEKGAHLAIEAAKKAQVPLVLAGTMDRSSKDAMNYFQEVIKPQVDDRQIRYVGPANMKRKIGLYSRARGFLNPIEWEEPFGMVMVEAMAVGCPVITFARGAAPELVEHGKTGFLVKNVDEMVKFIPRVDEIDRAVTREHVDQHFSARVMAQHYVEIYKQVISMSRQGSLPISAS